MKKVFAPALALILALSLAACGMKQAVQNAVRNAVGGASGASSQEYANGAALLKEERYEEALAAFTLAIEKQPQADEAYLGRADAYTALERASEALADYQAALRLSKSERAYLGAVNAYILMSDFDAALQMAQEGCEAAPSGALVAQRDALKAGNAVDSKGREHKITHYGDDGEAVWVHVTTYRPDGKIANKSAFSGAGAGMGSYDYEYDANGNRLKSCWYFWDEGLLMPVEEWYDENNRKTEHIGWGLGAVATNRTLFFYDGEGRLDKTQYWSNWENNPEDYHWEVRSWNEFGKLASLYIYEKDETTVYDYTLYEYDADENLVKETTYWPDGSMYYAYTYEYDAAGRKIREYRYNDKGELVGTTEY